MKNSKQQILNLESDNLESIDMPVECLGMTFENDEARNRVARYELGVAEGKD